jgi:transglutaminase-like putative cysteine protease
MMLLGTPLMLLLFLLFPRLAPLWGLPADALGGRSGLSERMQVGQVARLALDSSLAFRVRFEGPPPAQDKLYFRGPVLSRFDGIEWLPAPLGAAAAGTVLRVEGEPVRYQVTLEPSQQHWLFVLEATAQTPVLPGYQPYVNAELQWFTERPLNELVRYEARSHIRFSYGLEATPGALQPLLALPAGYNPRTLALARQLRQEIESASAAGRDAGAALVARALELLRQGGYRYTLEPGIYGRDSADEFWFDRRAGFCEHIAASFVILMRAAGLPARIVTGYQGGEHNPVDGYWSVRQSDAHAWAEVWLQGQGWTRVDPTAAVLPERIEGPQRLQPAAGLLADALIRVSPGLAAAPVLGGGQPVLEPLGARLQPGQAARPARATRVASRRDGRSGAPVVGPAGSAEPGGCRLGAAAGSRTRSVARPAAAGPAQAAAGRLPRDGTGHAAPAGQAAAGRCRVRPALAGAAAMAAGARTPALRPGQHAPAGRAAAPGASAGLAAALAPVCITLAALPADRTCLRTR